MVKFSRIESNCNSQLQFCLLYKKALQKRFENIINYIYRLPTDIQFEAIPLILGGGDVLMVKLFVFNRHCKIS